MQVPLELKLQGGCELSHVDARNQTWGLWKRMSSPDSRTSSSDQLFFFSFSFSTGDTRFYVYQCSFFFVMYLFLLPPGFFF